MTGPFVWSVHFRHQTLKFESLPPIVIVVGTVRRTGFCSWKPSLAWRCVALCLFIGLGTACCSEQAVPEQVQPNILIAISDDQSYPHASAYGASFVSTPAFDRIARDGLLFTAAYAGSPGCAPSRAALLTGLHHWQLGMAGTHGSRFPRQYVTFMDRLSALGYQTGFTGKGWGPGSWAAGGRTLNPAGREYSLLEKEPPIEGASSTDYAANFRQFLTTRRDGQPFSFWFGSREPHRRFEKDSFRRFNKNPEDAEVPPYLPDTPVVRGDLLDYAVEIEWFDQQLARMIQLLEETGQLDKTLIIVTSDNGMAFPRAKANAYDAGVHVPLAMRLPGSGGRDGPVGRVVDVPVGFVDLTATILDVAGLTAPDSPGHSLLPLLRGSEELPADRAVFSGRERHSSSRHQNLGYPQRALRTGHYLLIRNFAPDRWPAGDPQKVSEGGGLDPPHTGYHDIDACPTLTEMVERYREPEMRSFLNLAVARRPAWELFDLQTDPDCLHNLADQAEHVQTLEGLQRRLLDTLERSGDPRGLGFGNVWEAYPRMSGTIRRFPDPTETEVSP